mmetsp:Transcript_18031/g.27936  ORF Transcript_18031/g.27936 Transcript_18031/m.27936 type:complete len:1210 (-) Transcript_18031:105-3734(-)
MFSENTPCEPNDEEGSSKGSYDQHSSSGGGVSTESFHTGTSEEEEARHIKDQLSRRETTAVFRLRVIVILILIAAATSVSITVYYVTRNAEKEEFETQYYGVADKIIQSFQEMMVEIAAVSGMAVAASGEVLGQKEQWPFVTIPNFQERAGNARTLSGAIYLSINPVVATDQLPDWEKYIRGQVNSWIEDGKEFQAQKGLDHIADLERADTTWLTFDKVDPLHTFDEIGNPTLSQADGPFLPRWQSSPVLPFSMVNENILEHPEAGPISRDCITTNAAVLGGLSKAPSGGVSDPHPGTSLFALLESLDAGERVEYAGDPVSHLAIPVFDTLNGTERKVVAVLQSTIHWRTYLRDLLPATVQGITVVIENACDGFYTYTISGPEAFGIGSGDKHDHIFDDYQVEGRFLTERIEDGTIAGITLNQEGCPYTFHVYPSQTYYEGFITKDPVVISLSVAAVFTFTIIMFLLYDRLVEQRQRLVLAKATQSTAIVSSLFPKQVRDRLMAAEGENKKGSAMMAPNQRLKTFLSGSTGFENNGSQPIADLFPHCTVLFADISGFTAWSSTREPAQVFILLQSVYQAFDAIAKRRRVFKVETIGDSYVAVTGLPEPQPNHTQIMAKFTWDCLVRVGEVTKELEVQLGPDTGDLSMRFGLHSGPVTAGVLKGDRARFQLFGDTVNTAARMESTGIKGRIQVSQATADILSKVGKAHWLTPREDTVEAKGKGVMKTYWMALGTTVRAASVASSEEMDANRSSLFMANEGQNHQNLLKQDRLVDWMVDILLENIKKIVVVRQRCGKNVMSNEDLHYFSPAGKICSDEIKDAIRMPEFDAKVASASQDSGEVEVPYDVTGKLKEYVSMIAKSYRQNSFHNFEHACHVTMSVSKLLARIVAPDITSEDIDRKNSNKKTQHDDVAAQIHDYTYGITSDPMAVFAIIFSALIHDVDHQGVSNMQLAKEEPEMGTHYRNKSVAEQNSLDVAWDLLMGDQFQALRKYIFGSKDELLRFRQLIVNIVLATDIFDKENNESRKHRWERAFHGDGNLPGNVVSDLRATIVMEHIIQASDVSHTMQHWHVYQKWNRKLFTEMYTAFRSGRMGADPRDFWYQGELKFFDNYIIPLSQKLQECNVFGVSSDEYLSYALLNRAEWEERGRDIVANILEEIESSQEPSTKAVTSLAMLSETEDESKSVASSQSRMDDEVTENRQRQSQKTQFAA